MAKNSTGTATGTAPSATELRRVAGGRSVRVGVLARGSLIISAVSRTLAGRPVPTPWEGTP